MSQILFGLFGLSVLLAIAWLFSDNKKRVDWRLVATGVALQIAFAAFVLRTDIGSAIFGGLGQVFVTLIGFTNAGSDMILGSFDDQSKYGFVFIFHALPTMIFFASFMAMLYHLGVMQTVVAGHGLADHQADARLRRRDHQRLRQRVHRPDRGAADRAPLHQRR